MNTISVTLALFLVSIFSCFSAQSETIELPQYSKVYDEQRDPFVDARAAITLAAKTKRNVLIAIGGNWCAWCHKMDVFFEKNRDLYQLLHQRFVLLKINVSDTNENEQFMQSLPPVLGYPHMYVSTGTGKMMLSKDTGEFLEDGEHSRVAWLNFLNKWQIKNNERNLAMLSEMSEQAEE